MEKNEEKGLILSGISAFKAYNLAFLKKRKSLQNGLRKYYWMSGCFVSWLSKVIAKVSGTLVW